MTVPFYINVLVAKLVSFVEVRSVPLLLLLQRLSVRLRLPLFHLLRSQHLAAQASEEHSSSHQNPPSAAPGSEVLQLAELNPSSLLLAVLALGLQVQVPSRSKHHHLWGSAAVLVGLLVGLLVVVLLLGQQAAITTTRRRSWQKFATSCSSTTQPTWRKWAVSFKSACEIPARTRIDLLSMSFLILFHLH